MTRTVRQPHVAPAGGASSSPAGTLSAVRPRPRALARLAYVVVVLFATLPGTGWAYDPVLVRANLARALHPSLSPGAVLDGIRNVALFSGLGLVWIATTRTRRLWPPVWRATAAGALLSLGVEASQLASPVRFASVVDVATNAAGAFLGALAAAAVVRAVRWEMERGAADVPWLVVAASYGGAAALEAFSPWGRVDRVPGAWGGAARRFDAALAWSAAHALALPTLSDLLLFAPAGALAAVAAPAYGASPLAAAIRAALAAAAVFGAAELARGAAGGDMRPLAVATRVLVSALGATAAAALVDRRRLDGRLARRWVAAAVAALLACWYWRPFVLRSPGSAGVTVDNLVPLRSLLGLFSIYSVADVAVDFLLFFPLGVWLAIRPLRSGGPLGGVLPACWLCGALEVGQLAVAGRTADVTDVLVGCAGSLVGAAVVRQARLRVLRGRSSGGDAPPSAALFRPAGGR